MTTSNSKPSLCSAEGRQQRSRERPWTSAEPEQPQQPEQVYSSSTYAPLDLKYWGDDFEAGRVALCVDEWAKITSDHTVLSAVRGIKIDFDEDLPSQNAPMPEIAFSQEERAFIRKEIVSLLRKKVIVRATHVTGEYISNIFLVEKSTPGTYRMILNLKRLNQFTAKVHFKMETLMNILNLIVPDCSMMSIDFPDAYSGMGFSLQFSRKNF